MPPDAKSVGINASGKRYAWLNLGYRYNINYANIKAAFSLQPNVKWLNVDHMSLEIKVKYQPSKSNDSLEHSNFVILEASLPSGFVINTDLFDDLKSTLPVIKHIETMSADTVAVIHFDYLSSQHHLHSILNASKFISQKIKNQLPTWFTITMIITMVRLHPFYPAFIYQIVQLKKYINIFFQLFQNLVPVNSIRSRQKIKVDAWKYVCTLINTITNQKKKPSIHFYSQKLRQLINKSLTYF